MGNCQAIDAATLVIQHPSGKVDKLYWPVNASEIMKANPGHYVALLISTTLCPTTTTTTSDTNCPDKTTENKPVRVTRIKLLRPTDTLALGHVYRLITAQDVMKGLGPKKQAKMRKALYETAEKAGKSKEKLSSGAGSTIDVPRRSEMETENHQVTRHERHRQRSTTATNSAATARPRTWQPSLNSISEAAS